MNAYLTTKEKEQCCGCRSCEKICPQGCIAMEPDCEGFLYPQINEEKCTKCGLCEKRCPINKDTTRMNLKTPKVYAAWHKDNEVLDKSSSGGVFSALANYTLGKRGTVVGCALGENLVAKQILVDNEKDLYKLRGSKYVQSDTMNSFIQVKDLLKQGNHVCYTGTPCQIAGLKSHLGRDYGNLFTVDLICHGVPSPQIFSKYLEYLEQKYNGKVSYFNFRDKTKYGWEGYGFKFGISKNGKIVNRRDFGYLSPYGYGFFKNYFQRPICYKCPYTTTKREGDITLADFWGVEKFHPEIDASNGVSLVLVNTKKGEIIFNELGNEINKVLSSLNNAKYQNHHLQNPSEKPELRDIIYKEITKLGFDKASQKYLTPKNLLVVKLKALIPPKLKRKLKKAFKRN